MTDTSEFTLSSEDTLWVHITDENDEDPVFTSSSTLDLPEYTANGRYIIMSLSNTYFFVIIVLCHAIIRIDN